MSEPYDHGKDMADFFHITQEFKRMMEKDTSDDKVYEVSSISKVNVQYEGDRQYSIPLIHLILMQG